MAHRCPGPRTSHSAQLLPHFGCAKTALRWFLWERFRHRPSSAGENNDLELKRPREGPFPRHPPMIAKPNSDNRRGVTHEESTTSRPRSGPHGRPGRAHRGRAHRRERPALQARAAPLPRMRQGLRLLRHGEPRGPQAVEGDGGLATSFWTISGGPSLLF